MFTTTFATLAAAAALNAQAVTANAPAAVKTVAAPIAAASTVSAPDTAAIAASPKAKPRREVRIPGTFAVGADQDPLAGLHVFFMVRSGDGA